MDGDSHGHAPGRLDAAFPTVGAARVVRQVMNFSPCGGEPCALGMAGFVADRLASRSDKRRPARRLAWSPAVLSTQRARARARTHPHPQLPWWRLSSKSVCVAKRRCFLWERPRAMRFVRSGSGRAGMWPVASRVDEPLSLAGFNFSVCASGQARRPASLERLASASRRNSVAQSVCERRC